MKTGFLALCFLFPVSAFSQVISWMHYDSSNSSITSNWIHAIAVDRSSDKVWASSGDLSAGNDKVYSFENGTWNQFAFTPAQDVISTISSILIDKNGIVWLTDNPMAFGTTNYPQTKCGLVRISSDHVSVIAPGQLTSCTWCNAAKPIDMLDDNDNLIVLEQEIYAPVNPQDCEPTFVQQYSIKINDTMIVSSTNVGYVVDIHALHPFLIDKDNEVWSGEGYGILRKGMNYDPGYYECTTLGHYGRFFSMVQDTDGSFLLLAMGSGLGIYRFDGSNFTIVFDQFTGVENANPWGFSLHDMKLDTHGNLWMAGNKGLLRLHDNQLTQYCQKNSGIPDDFITCFDFDSKGNVWFGTQNSGVGELKLDYLHPGMSQGGVATPLVALPATNFFSASPNPFRERIDLQLPSYSEGTSAIAKAALFNSEGKEIFQTNIQSANSTIETTDLPPGIYILKIYSADNNELLKLVKQ